MKIVDNLFKKKCILNHLQKKGKCLIVNVDNKKYVIKADNNHISSLYSYLNSRGFNNYPKLLLNDDKYNVYEFIDNVNSSIEQKAYDLIELLSLLHSKTTYYKTMDIDEYKELFENSMKKIDSTVTYYNNLMNNIEIHMFMSPSEYLIARNISKIMSSLESSKNSIISWYDLVKTKAKKRIVTLYNNIDLDHILRNKDLYLLSWDKSKEGIPIYDLYEFYNKYSYLNIDDLLDYYEKKYPLLEEEKLLLSSLISIPPILEFTSNELDNCKNIKKVIDNIYRSEILVSKLKNI